VKYTYLIINLLTVVFPVALSFDKRVAFAKSWKYLWPGMGITGLVFLFWDVLFTVYGVWSFNPQYIAGIKFIGLPLEEILFFLTVPFSCVFIYACLNYYIKWEPSFALTRMISNLLIGVSVSLLVFNYTRLYTAVTFGLLVVLLVVLVYFLKVEWLGRFYMAFVVSLIPFYIVNGILTAWPVVIYNNAQNMGIRAGTIPFEDHFYSMALLLMNVAFYEYFKTRKTA
jgi:lycopene cyclase domain-containing protein